MKSKQLLIVITSRYSVFSGHYWTTTSYNYDMFREALASWNTVVVAAPCVDQVPVSNATEADGSGVEFHRLPDSVGIFGGILAFPSRFWKLRSAVKSCDGLVLHVPSDIGFLAFLWARIFGKPYSIDVRGSQSLDHAYLKHRGAVGSKWIARTLACTFKWVRSRAVGAVFVSRKLSEDYPLSERAFSIVASDIRLPDWWFTGSRDFGRCRKSLHICTVGRLETGKGLDVLIRAFAELSAVSKSNLSLEIIGSGPELDSLESLVHNLAITQQVTFSGFVPWGRQLHQKLLEADVFVLASMSEGMPRAAIEAMATGLPVVATDVGGLPELLESTDLVAPNDAASLATLLVDVVEDHERLALMSKRNFARSEAFRLTTLRDKKIAFYEALREAHCDTNETPVV